jgi:hypothetical protein
MFKDVLFPTGESPVARKAITVLIHAKRPVIVRR